MTQSRSRTAVRAVLRIARDLLGLVSATVRSHASLRANTASDLQRVFLDPIDVTRSASMIGAILGVPFLGFALTIAIGSPLLDYIGMGVLLPLAGLFLALGSIVFVTANAWANVADIYYVLWGARRSSPGSVGAWWKPSSIR